MNWSSAQFVLALLLLIAGDFAHANAPPPLRKPVNLADKVSAPVEVKTADLAGEGKGVGAKIVIPRKLLAKFASGELPVGLEPTQPALPWWSTIIAGVALAMGAVGLLFYARGNKAARVAAAGCVLAMAVGGGYALADIRFPDEKPPAASVVIQLVDEGDAVVITLAPTS